MLKIRTFAAFLFFTLKLFGQTDSSKSEIKAQANETISTSIILEEKDFRKINEVITKRIKEVADSTFNIRYKVSFSNNSYYTTNNFEYILKEENSDLRRITELQISSFTKIIDSSNKQNKINLIEDESESIMVNISLSSGELTYSITGGNRDWVLNSQTDLKERFNLLEDKKTFTEIYFPFLGLFFYVLFIGIFFLFFAKAKRKKYIEIQKAKGNNSAYISLTNYIFKFHDPHISLKSTLIFVYVCFSSIFLFYLLFRYLKQFFFPNGMFLLGEQITKYEKIVSTRDFFINSVIIGLIISIVASLIANNLTNKTEKK